MRVGGFEKRVFGGKREGGFEKRDFGDKRPRPGDRFGAGKPRFGGKPGERRFGGDGAPAPRPSAGRFSADKSHAEGFTPPPKLGGGTAPPRRRDFGPPSGPARFSGPPKKKHGRMGK
jgi:hypothetical protein